MPSASVLDIDNLTVAYRQGDQWLPAVRDFSLTIEPGQTYGLVGESGSGKTTIALAIMRYLGEGGQVRQGTIEFNGRDLLSLSQDEMRELWGSQLALVPQDPLSSLNPAVRVGEQLAEGLRQHLGLSRPAARARVLELLQMVRLADPERVADSYPHLLSGGMQQRVMIAMALSTDPLLLVLDEPTTNLDVTTQAAVLDLFRDLIHERSTAALYVTHNLGVVARLCGRVAVLYAGERVEDAPTADLFRQPLHPYTQGLLDSVPQLGQNKHTSQLRPIDGLIPPLGARPEGCVFRPRCPLAIEICRERPPLYAAGPGRLTRCHRWDEIAAGGQVASSASRWLASGKWQVASGSYHSPLITYHSTPTPQPTLNLNNLQVHFPIRRRVSDVARGRPGRQVKAVNGVNLALASGQTVGLVGESGSGKTTLARAIMGLVERTGGRAELLGVQLPPGLSERGLETLRQLQMVFQNPEEALNPYLTIGETLRRPLITLLGQAPRAADEEVSRLLAAVRLPADYAHRLPRQLSGGEKQRVAIARAFAANPDLLLCDEPVSALDVSVQASILNLLNDLQSEHQSAMLFISHDLAVVGYLADVVAVIYLGRLMEVAPAAELFRPPYHPYTEALLSAIPLPDPAAHQEQIRLEGEVPSQTAAISGCPFHPRCPRFLGELCVNEPPPWQTAANGQQIYCHIPLDDLKVLQQREK